MRQTQRTVSLVIALAAGAVFLGASGSAHADAIDGTWCAPDGRSLTIQGPAITTPGGNAVQGDYNRHGFAYTVPEGEPGSGQPVVMRLLNEEEVRVVEQGTEAIWHRCETVS